MSFDYVKSILRSPVYDVAIQTPLQELKQLSERLDNKVMIKREDLQPVNSFKLRGAYNKVVSLTPEERAKGVITASAGNHAQGVALSAQCLGISAVIVMPVTTPSIKVSAVKALGGKVVLFGDNFDDAKAHAMQLVTEKGLTFIHPFDDPFVIAGQGTIGKEILQQLHDNPTAIFIPVGGGGLIAGIVSYVKWLAPEVKIIGVEPKSAPTLHTALKAGKPVELTSVGNFADGVAVRLIGEETFRICQQLVDEVVLVGADEICAAIRDIFEATRGISEPSGALSLAGLKKWTQQQACHQQTLVAIESGANINFDKLRHVAERAGLGEQKEVLLAVEIPEKKGSFQQFCKILGKRQITEFKYRYAQPGAAHIFVGIELRKGSEEAEEIIVRLRDKGLKVYDMSKNETTKQHIRYMIGGHARDIGEETLIKVEFPERPGTLMNFLSTLGGRWNISLFHYRNQGDIASSVLFAVQVPEKEKSEFFVRMDELGYPYQEESDNLSYQIFAGVL